MKKLIIVVSALAMVAGACHKKAAPTVATRTEQPPPPTPPSPPKQETVDATYAAADIAAGKIIYEGKCTRCHAAKPVGNYTGQRWPGILRSMVPKSKLNEEETRQVTAYVMTNARKG